MRRLTWAVAASVGLFTSMAVAPAVRADFELTGADGRRILLMDNGTWRYIDAADESKGASKSKEQGEAVLFLERKIERGNNCRFALRLVNGLPYEIRSLVLYYSAYRANGVIYDTVSSGSSFASMKPGDKQLREIDFMGIACPDIVRLQVVGGDRCDMGELDKFSATKGQCLARVRVVESALVQFDK